MMKQRISDRSILVPKQILLEGRTPEMFFREWIMATGLEHSAEARNFGSLQELTPYLKVFTKLQRFREFVTSIAIIRDAEDQPAKSGFDSVCSSLKDADLPLPTL